MDIFSNPTAYAAPVIDDDLEDDLLDLGRDSYAQTPAGEEGDSKGFENGFFYEAADVIEKTKQGQKESGNYGLFYDSEAANGNYYEPAGAYGDDDDSNSLSDEVNKFRTKIQKPLSTSIQDFAKSYYWNERFQVLLERPTFTPKEIAIRQADIDHFVQEFVLVAKPICEQIVKEISLPVEKKQVKPIAAGGIAGGEKYLHKDLFLKFARDHIQIQLYGGDEWAQKAAFHELKSLSSLISCGVPNLHFPMMCLVKCYGHCLVVVSKLPLSGNTLIYGSANAAVDIKTDNYDMETMLKQVTQTLNLKPHQVIETRTKMLKTVYGPVDIEGHQGLDGRYYVVDTARLFPPATPIAKVKGCHLYKLLRPELVKANPVPLSSDAFSSFGRPNQREHNEEVREATRRVLADIIPNKLARSRAFLSNSVKDELHAHGVNVRYLGSVYVHSKDRTHPKYERDVHLTLLVELVARAFKGVLFTEWRKIDAEIPIKSKTVAIKYFNLLLGSGPTTNNFWKSTLKDAVVKRFIFYSETEAADDIDKHLQYAESALEPNWHSLLSQTQGCKLKLFERAFALTGVEFSKPIMENINKNWQTTFNAPTPFKQGDVSNIQLLAKYIEVKPFMDVLRSNFEEAEKFYLDELKSRREILGDDHVQLAFTHINLADLYSDKNKQEQAEQQYDKALRIMKAVGADVGDIADLREKRADFYMKYDNLEQAENELKLVIDLKVKYLTQKGFSKDSLAVAALKDKLARVYTKQQRFDEAKQTLEDVIRIKQQKLDQFHWQVAKSLNNLAQVLFAQKEYYKAEPICQNVLDILIRQRGPEHSEVGIALDNLAKIYAATGRREKAQKLLEQAKDIKIKAFGDTHTYVGTTLDHLASNLLATVTNDHPNKEKILEECKVNYEKALSIFKTTYGDMHSALGITNNNLGLLHLKLKKYNEALQYFEKAHTIFMHTMGAASPLTSAALKNINLIKEQNGQDVLETLNFEQAYHSGEMYADASEKPVDESTQLDEATAALIRELGFDPSQFTKTQAAQILELLNSIQPETPTPTPTPGDPGYGQVEAGDEYEGSAASSDLSSSSEDWEGYEDEDEGDGDADDILPYAETLDRAPSRTNLAADPTATASDQQVTLERQSQLLSSYGAIALDEAAKPEKRPSLTKRRSSKFFDSVKSTVKHAFSFWKSKEKQSGSRADYDRANLHQDEPFHAAPLGGASAPRVAPSEGVNLQDVNNEVNNNDNVAIVSEYDEAEPKGESVDDEMPIAQDIRASTETGGGSARADFMPRTDDKQLSESAYSTAYDAYAETEETYDQSDKQPVKSPYSTGYDAAGDSDDEEEEAKSAYSTTYDAYAVSNQNVNDASRAYAAFNTLLSSTSPVITAPPTSPTPPMSDTAAPVFHRPSKPITAISPPPPPPSSEPTLNLVASYPTPPQSVSPGAPTANQAQSPKPSPRPYLGSSAPTNQAQGPTTPLQLPPSVKASASPQSNIRPQDAVSAYDPPPTLSKIKADLRPGSADVQPARRSNSSLSLSLPPTGGTALPGAMPKSAASTRSSGSSRGRSSQGLTVSPSSTSNTNRPESASNVRKPHKAAPSTASSTAPGAPSSLKAVSKSGEKSMEVHMPQKVARKSSLEFRDMTLGDDSKGMKTEQKKDAQREEEIKDKKKLADKSRLKKAKMTSSAGKKLMKSSNAASVEQTPEATQGDKEKKKKKDKKEKKEVKVDRKMEKKELEKESISSKQQPVEELRKRKSVNNKLSSAPEALREKVSYFASEEPQSVSKPKILTKSKRTATATSSAPVQPQQPQQTPSALLNNLSEEQRANLRQRLQQLTASAQPQQQPQPQQQQNAPAMMQFNWTNI